MNKYNKAEKSWILYDCTISTYSMIIITTILPIYFRMVFKNAGGSEASSTAYWGYSNSIGRLLIALLAPLLGTIADYIGYKMKFFKVFCIIGIIFTALIAAVPNSAWLPLVIVFIISTIGNAGSNVFYDAFLVDITPKSKMDMLSSIAYACGYLGNILAFAVCMSIVILAQLHIIPISIMTACKITFVITAIWCTMFSIPIMKNVKQIYGIKKEHRVIVNSIKRLGSTFKNIGKHKNLVIFLISYFFFIDGVNTIITMATSFGADIGINSTVMLVVLLFTQFIAFPCAIIFGKLSEKFKGKTMLYAGIIIYSIICVYANFIHNILGFIILAVLVGTSQGGIQALSRSYFGKLVPKEKNNEFFGFFNIFGRFASILGPLLVAVITQITGKSTNGIFSILILFVIGGIVLTKVKDAREDEDDKVDDNIIVIE
ncbi:UMF1 family MFS transporter [Clostridium acetobutylicum]|uniref:Predicted permease, YXIO B.subtilis ortholog n=1 Tax=Clostridium acetobutylicum (strain ATCC 824 / DSM 792 / JCM 1419 / IAM 19013 / LMG 5710 / NBRC 13948 / NRRL B-527 / VKM B-1787 / 2291 / W) TaxID=272562 RepID=Q97FJ4_CLOAB|nr:MULTISPECIES: MFS transporter [Clostridium]AAK80689.1 Predicted permease, YXIO B.subtilis ortholog [Clostridium acetobutylicum ATCC 824]ADZ21789.1 MDR-type permease [Clostridium acetobutylicum EA 2018]AEI34655.1 permease [Clostridium acetobutylicum DSM 1731]AWV78897.1 MFS transporter [Clostridium acetobutylicum]MBC2395135.1 MFS transporter [Clostridium acetobutylicum]